MGETIVLVMADGERVPLAPRDPAIIDSYRSCFTARGKPKKKYRNRWIARRTAAEITAQDGEQMVAYVCPVCQRYHIGHARNGEHHA